MTHTSFPSPLYARFRKLAKKLGYPVRGHLWFLFSKMLDFVEDNPDSFKQR
jgi:hypothetical protein